MKQKKYDNSKQIKLDNYGANNGNRETEKGAVEIGKQESSKPDDDRA